MEMGKGGRDEDTIRETGKMVLIRTAVYSNKLWELLLNMSILAKNILQCCIYIGQRSICSVQYIKRCSILQ